MELYDKLTKQISETKYLAQENTYRYRPIMRFFYREYEKTKYWLYKEDVYEAFRGMDLFKDYSLEDCERDLEVLTEWESLTKVQDTTNANTIQEFKDRKYRYQITDYGVQIEQLTIELENLDVQTSSLEPRIFERIKNKLQELLKYRSYSESEINEIWNDLNHDFTSLNKNYQSFLKKFNEAKTEELLHSTYFMEFKSEMIQYLKEFIQSYQRNIYFIKDILSQITDVDRTSLMDSLIHYERQKPKMVPAFDFKHLREVNVGKLQNIQNWFLADKTGSSEGDRMIRATHNIIVKITKYASSLVELRGNMTSRKEEYKYICTLFDQQTTIEECHKLSSLIFGIDKVKHFSGSTTLASDQILPTYDMAPIEIVLEPKKKGRKSKGVVLPIIDKSRQKEKILEEKALYEKNKKKLLSSLVQDGRISLTGHIFLSQMERRYVFDLLTKKGNTKETEFGYGYRIISGESLEKCIIESEDGVFEMPALYIEFVGDDHE